MKMLKHLLPLMLLLSTQFVEAAKGKKSGKKGSSKKSAQPAAGGGQSTAAKHNKKGATAAAATPAANAPTQLEQHHAALTSMLQLFQGSVTSPMLDDGQKAYVSNPLIPTLEQELAGSAFQQSIESAFNQTSTSTTISQLTQLTQSMEGKQLDQASRDAYAQALKDLINTSQHLDPASMQALSNLITQLSPSTTLLSPDALAGLKSNIPALTPIPNQQNVTLALTQEEHSDQISTLTQIVMNSDGQKIDPVTQNTFAQGLQNLVNNAKLLDPNDMLMLHGLLTNAINSPMLSPAQQQYIQNNLISTITTTITTETIESILSQTTVDDRIASMQAIIDTHGNKPVTPDQQNIIAQGLIKIASDPSSLTPQQRIDLIETIKNAADNGLITPEQHDYFIKNIIPGIAPQPTVDTIKVIGSDPSVDNKIKGLQALIIGTGGKQVDPAAQNEVAKILMDLQKELPNMTPEQITQYQALLKEISGSNVLSPDQQKYVTEQLLPAATPKLNAQAIDAIKGLPSPQDQLDQLKIALQQHGNNPLDVPTQSSYALLLNDLINKAKNGQLTDAQRLQLQQLLADSSAQGLLTPDQQKYIASQLPSVIPPASPAVIQAITSGGGSVGDVIGGLAQILDNHGVKPADAATQEAFGTALQDLIGKAQAGKLSDAEKIQLQQLLDKAGKSGLLSPAQQQYVNGIVPSIAPAVSPESISNIVNDSGTTGDLIGSLGQLVKNQGNKLADSATQDVFAGTLQQLIDKAKAGKLSGAEQVQLQKLLRDASNSGLLSPEQQAYVAQQVADLTPALSPDAVNNVVANSHTPKDLINNLDQIIRNNGGKVTDANTQNAIAGALQGLLDKANNGQLSDAEKIQLQKLLKDATKSGVLSPAQLDYFNKQVPTIAPAVSADVIGAVVANSNNPHEVMRGLDQIMQNVGNKPIDAATQNAFAGALDNLITQAKNGQLSDADKLQLQKLLSEASKSGILTPAQQQYVNQQSQTIAPIATPDSIGNIIKNSNSAGDLIGNLDQIIKNTGNKPVDAATANAIAGAIDGLITQAKNGQLSDPEKIKLQTLLDHASNSGLLTPAQQAYIAQQADAIKPALTTDAINAVVSGSHSAGDLMKNLDHLISSGGDKPIDPAAQNAFASALDSLIQQAKAGKLSNVEKIQLQQMLDNAVNSGLLSPDQKKYVQGQIDAIKPKNISSTDVAALLGGNSSDQDAINGIKYLLDKHGNEKFDAATQNIVAGKIKDLMDKAKAGTLSDEDRVTLKDLLDKVGDSGLVSPEQGKFIKDNAHTVTDGIPADTIAKIKAKIKKKRNKSAADLVGGLSGTISDHDAIGSLTDLFNNHGSEKFDPATQNIIAGKIQDLMNKAKDGKLSDEDRVALKDLVDKIADSGLVTPPQGKYIKDNSHVVIDGMPKDVVEKIRKKIKKQKGDAGNGSDSSDDAPYNGNNEHIKKIRDYITKSRHHKLTQQEQDDYASELDKLFKDLNNLNPDDQAEVHRIIKRTTETDDIVSPKHRRHIKDTMSDDGSKAITELDTIETDVTTRHKSGKKATAADQNALALKLQQQFDNRPRDNRTYLTKFKKLLEYLITTDMLSDAQKEHIRTVMIPALDADIAAIPDDSSETTTITKNRKSTTTTDDGSGTDSSSSDPRSRGKHRKSKTTETTITETVKKDVTDIGNAIEKSKKGKLTPDEQNDVAKKIQHLFDNRGKGKPSLDAVHKAIEDALNSDAITPEQKDYIRKNLKPTLDQEKQQADAQAAADQGGDGSKKNNNGTSGNAGTGTGAGKVNDQVQKDVDAVNAAIDKAKTQPPSAADQNDTASKLQHAFDNRGTDKPSLDAAHKALTDAINSNAISDAQKAYIKDKLIPAVEKDQAAAAAAAAQAGGAQDQKVALYNDKLAQLELLIANARPETPPLGQQKYAALTQDIFNLRQPNVQFTLEHLIDVLGQLKTTSLVSDSFKAHELNGMFNTLRGEQAKVLGVKS